MNFLTKVGSVVERHCMKDQLSATIIPFPIRHRDSPAKLGSEALGYNGPGIAATMPPRAVMGEQPHTLAASAQRLTFALNGLTTALADQRDATQRWKSALEDLATKMRTIGDVSTFGKNAG